MTFNHNAAHSRDKSQPVRDTRPAPLDMYRLLLQAKLKDCRLWALSKPWYMEYVASGLGDLLLYPLRKRPDLYLLLIKTLHPVIFINKALSHMLEGSWAVKEPCGVSRLQETSSQSRRHITVDISSFPRARHGEREVTQAAKKIGPVVLAVPEPQDQTLECDCKDPCAYCVCHNSLCVHMPYSHAGVSSKNKNSEPGARGRLSWSIQYERCFDCRSLDSSYI